MGSEGGNDARRRWFHEVDLHVVLLLLLLASSLCMPPPWGASLVVAFPQGIIWCRRWDLRKRGDRTTAKYMIVNEAMILLWSITVAGAEMMIFWYGPGRAVKS